MKTENKKSFSLAPVILDTDESSKNNQIWVSVKNALYVFLTASAVMLSLLIAADRIELFVVESSMFFMAIILPAFFACAYMLFSHKWLILLASHLGILLYIWLAWQKLFDGAVLLVRETILLVNDFYGTYYRYPMAPDEFERTSYYSAIILLLTLILSSLLCFLLSKGSGVVVSGLSLLGVFFVCTNLTQKTVYLPIFLALLAFLSAFSIYASSLSRKMKKNRFVVSAFSSGFANGVLSVLIVVSLLISAVFAFVPKEEQVYEAPLAKVATNPEAIYELLPLIRKFNLFNNSFLTWGAGVGTGQLNAGLRSTGTGKTDLMVSIPLTTRASVLPYLKGYAGSRYNSKNMQWEDLPDKVYEDNSSLFNQLKSRQLTVQSITKGYSSLEFDLGENSITSKVFVRNVDANRKYSYFPYNSITDNFSSSQFKSVDFHRDTYIKGKNVDDDAYYFDTIRMYHDHLEQAVEIIYPEFYKSYKKYYDFVLDNYLELPDKGVERIKAAGSNLRETLDEEFAQSGLESDNYMISGTVSGEGGNSQESPIIPDYENMNIKNATYLVKNYLKDHAVYDLACGETPSGKDFAEYFLYENNKGYCVHFATAGTLLFRAMGIPARYVEGYIMTGKELDSSETWKEIPDSNAHAWVEIFSNVTGWQPVEVTPGFTVAEIAPPSQNVEVPPEITENVSSELASEPEASSQPEISSAPSSELLSSTPASSQGTSSATSIGSAEQESDSQGDEDVKNEPKPMSTSTKIILLFILASCATLFALWLVAFLARKKREKRFGNKNSNVAYRYVYEYMISLLEFVGIKQEIGEGDEVFAIRAEQELCEILSSNELASKGEDGKLLTMTKKALLAKFSNKALDEQEVFDAVDFYNRTATQIHQRLSVPKRLAFMFTKLMK